MNGWDKRPQTISILCVIGIALTMSVGSAFAGASGNARESGKFNITAVYRGIVKKVFPDLGSSQVDMKVSEQKSPARTHKSLEVKIVGQMRHPQKKDTIIKVASTCAYTLGTHIQMTSASHDIPGDMKDCRTQMENVLPFIYLARAGIAQNNQGPHKKSFLLGKTDVKGRELIEVNYETTGVATWRATITHKKKVQAKLQMTLSQGELPQLTRLEIPIRQKKLHLIMERINGTDQMVLTLAD